MNSSQYLILGYVVGAGVLWGYILSLALTHCRLNKHLRDHPEITHDPQAQ